MSPPLRRLAGEFLGTALLLFVIVGSGIAADRLTDDAGLELVIHAIAVGIGLGAIIAFLAPVSGAHFNPAVTLGFWLTRAMTPMVAVSYVAAQLLGAIVGVIGANFVFGEVLVAESDIVRTGGRLVASELIVTFVLVLLVLGMVRSGHGAGVAAAVGAWVVTIILASPSTGFANPAVTVARGFTDTYTGIEIGSVPWFVGAQLLAGIAAAGAALALYPAGSNGPVESDDTSDDER